MKAFIRIIQISVLQLLLVLSTSISVKSQTFDIDTILYNGDPDKFINFVYMGDGYKAEELSAYIEHVTTTSNFLFTTHPFTYYKNYFNVFAIKISSNESGAQHPRTAPDCPPESEHPSLFVYNYFGSSFDYYDIHRLLVPTDYETVHYTLLENFPLYNSAFMLVNTPYHGGSGGWISTSSINEYSNHIVVHEIGHTFANLADEYWAGDMYAAEKANMTQETNPNLVKWKNWIGYEGVGIYQHGESGVAANWYRPHESCQMRFLDSPFCPVCTEAIVLRIIELFGNPILSYYPDQSNISLTEDSIQFNLNIVKPEPNTIRVKWILNGNLFTTNIDSVKIYSNQLLTGNNVLRVEVLDTTNLIRADNHEANNTFSLQWVINKNTSNIIVSDYENNIKVYPNPVSDDLIIEIEDNNNIVNFDIINSMGQVVYTGNLLNKTIVKTNDFTPGTYIIALENGRKFEFRKIVKK
jgi:hypothetical protein